MESTQTITVEVKDEKSMFLHVQLASGKLPNGEAFQLVMSLHDHSIYLWAEGKEVSVSIRSIADALIEQLNKEKV